MIANLKLKIGQIVKAEVEMTRTIAPFLRQQNRSPHMLVELIRKVLISKWGRSGSRRLESTGIKKIIS